MRGLRHVCAGRLDERGVETVGEPLRSFVEPVVGRRRVAVVGTCRDNARQSYLGELFGCGEVGHDAFEFQAEEDLAVAEHPVA